MKIIILIVILSIIIPSVIGEYGNTKGRTRVTSSKNYTHETEFVTHWKFNFESYSLYNLTIYEGQTTDDKRIVYECKDCYMFGNSRIMYSKTKFWISISADDALIDYNYEESDLSIVMTLLVCVLFFIGFILTSVCIFSSCPSDSQAKPGKKTETTEVKEKIN